MIPLLCFPSLSTHQSCFSPIPNLQVYHQSSTPFSNSSVHHLFHILLPHPSLLSLSIIPYIYFIYFDNLSSPSRNHRPPSHKHLLFIYPSYPFPQSFMFLRPFIIPLHPLSLSAHPSIHSSIHPSIHSTKHPPSHSLIHHPFHHPSSILYLLAQLYPSLIHCCLCLCSKLKPAFLKHFEKIIPPLQ